VVVAYTWRGGELENYLGSRGFAQRTQTIRGMMPMAAEYDFSKGQRGAVVPPKYGKTRITIRLDDEVVRWFRSQVHAAGGGNYQSLINLALRDHMKRQAEPLEETLRRILREEFRKQPAGLARAQRKTAARKTALRKRAHK